MRYLVEMLMSGEDGGEMIELEAPNDNEMWKQLYITSILGYDDAEQYEEYEEESDADLDPGYCRAQAASCEDVLVFVYNVTRQREVYCHDMWGWARYI